MLCEASLVLTLLAAAGPAGGKRLAVVELATPPTMIGLGAQVTQAIVQAAEQQGYTVIGPDQIRQAIGNKVYAELQACGSGVACASGKLGIVAPDRAILGSLGRDEKSYLLRLYHLDLRTLQVVADVDRAILIASRRLMPDATAAIPGLLRGEREARGTLKLTANVKGVDVTLDGAPVGQTPLTLELKPGKHEVKLEKRSYLPVERLVTVEAGQVTQEQVRMILAPGQRPPEEAAQVAAAQAAQEGPSLRIPGLAWVGYGATLAAAGGAVYFGSSARNAQTKLLEGYDADLDRYAGTRAQALKGRQDALMANVLFGVTAAALATAVTLTVVENSKAPAVQVAPAAGPSGGGVTLEGRF